MALHCPTGFPEDFWLPVVASEAVARTRLLSALDQIPWQRLPHSKCCDWTAIKGAVIQYLNAVVSTFAEQACEAVRARKFPAVSLDQAVEAFAELAMSQAYFALHNEKIRAAWSVHHFEGMKRDVRPQIMSAPWYLDYLSEVPEILQAFAEVRADPASRVRDSFVKPRLASKGWSVPQWARAAGVSQAVAYDYLNAKSELRPDSRKALAEALGVGPTELP